MLFRNTFAACAFACLVSAAPKQQQQPRELTYDDVILPRPDGSYEVMKKWEWSHLEQRMEREARSRAMENKRAALAGETVPAGVAGREALARRADDCEKSEEIQMLTDEYFTNWDVAMSPVIGAQGGNAMVAVSKGYTIANQVTVSVGTIMGPFPPVYPWLQITAGIDTSKTWTSSDTQTFTFTVMPGDYGVVVSNPYTRRITGNYRSGCTDSPTIDPFVSDSYEDQVFGDMELSWVKGPIYLCNSTTYPVPFCNGEGEHK